MPATLTRVIVSVSELDASLAFYEGLLGLGRTSAAPGLAFLRDGAGVQFLLHERPTTASDAAVAVALRVEQLDRLVDAVAAGGGTIVDPPALQPWGERMAVVRDPDGHVVCLVADEVKPTQPAADRPGAANDRDV